MPISFTNTKIIYFIIYIFLSLIIAACSKKLDAFEDRFLPIQEHIDSNELSIYWSGAASVTIDDGENSILIDPFVSRDKNSTSDIFFGRIAFNEGELIRKRSEMPEIARANSIFVSHSHYDHSLDAAYFGAETNAIVFGSIDTKRIINAHGYSNFVTINLEKGINKYKAEGGFTVTALRSKHGDPPTCFRPLICIDLLNERVADPFYAHSPLNKYGKGEVYAFFVEHELGNVLHIGSAGYVPGSLDALEDKEVDVLLLSLVGRRDTKTFLMNTVERVKPKLVIPIHFDYPFSPLECGLKITRFARLGEFFEAMDRFFPKVRVGILQFDQPWRIRKQAQDQ